VTEIREASIDQAELLRDLFDAGLLIDTGVPGVYGHDDAFERVVGRLESLLSELAGSFGASKLSFPPVVPRLNLENNGYVSKFPHLAASIFGFDGSDSDAIVQGQRAAAHEDWSEFQSQTDLMMLPAACYPVYPAIAERGRLGAEGASVDMGGTWVFRHEPSYDPARRQIFRQHELVRIGAPEEVVNWRRDWAHRGLELFRELGLSGSLENANDPFFGRQGRMLAANQAAGELKFELVVQIAGPEPTACASFNYHMDAFGHGCGLELVDGATAHTACVGFGLERITLALLRTHGLDPDDWPQPVRVQLGL
jgi:seryl-tRNA synthetase